MTTTVDQWIDEHFDDEEETYCFTPDELSFCVVEQEHEPNVFACVTPTRYFEEEGYMFDQSFTVVDRDGNELPKFGPDPSNRNWPEMAEGYWEPPQGLDASEAKKTLEEFGMTHSEQLAEFAKEMTG